MHASTDADHGGRKGHCTLKKKKSILNSELRLPEGQAVERSCEVPGGAHLWSSRSGRGGFRGFRGVRVWGLRVSGLVV